MKVKDSFALLPALGQHCLVCGSCACSQDLLNPACQPHGTKTQSHGRGAKRREWDGLPILPRPKARRSRKQAQRVGSNGASSSEGTAKKCPLFGLAKHLALHWFFASSHSACHPWNSGTRKPVRSLVRYTWKRSQIPGRSCELHSLMGGYEFASCVTLSSYRERCEIPANTHLSLVLIWAAVVRRWGKVDS